MDEKRIFERVEAPMKIKYEIIDKLPQSKTATSQDIGGGGIRLALDEKLGIGVKLKLAIQIPGEENKIASAYGKVVWTRKVEITGPARASSYYETGIEFIQADSLTIGKIFKYFQKRNE